MIKTRLSLTVQREGKSYTIGVVKGGHWGERLVARIRLWFWNRQTRRARGMER